MKEYDLIVIGSGSGMNYVGLMMQDNPEMKVAIIDKDKPGGICLTRGCIPSKMLLYPAELVREIGRANKFGIDAEIRSIDFNYIMERMRSSIGQDIDMIHDGLSSSPKMDYYKDTVEFVEPYVLKVGDETITSKMIYLSIGSKPMIPPVKGLEDASYLTSDNVLELRSLPKSLAIIGGGYIAAEYGHFFSSMGSDVTIIGRSSRIIAQEEPEISELAKKKMQKYMTILTNHEVEEVQVSGNRKMVIAKDRQTGEIREILADEILVATGRSPNTDILHPEKGNVETDERGWIKVNEHMETSCPNVWAFGDANGKYLFKHVGNYESTVAYQNSVLDGDVSVDYHAVPHAIFSYPEIAGVGMGEAEAVEHYGKDNISIGFHRFEDTGKGMAMALEDYFVKVIIENSTNILVGAHIIGPQASVLVHQMIILMNTPGANIAPIVHGMDIHPSLSEVVKRAFYSRMPVNEYHSVLKSLELEY
ncbi:dihydrolipoyl dehydrogenase [Methanococcoides methylutens]|uniref:Dihydrolipoamide dehydrogenase n=1 Tax=Methanococcoides methylutens MM1 TaxID=1434104 RepID=A0A0E3SNI0_METMT|nr:dihydrolipoyl dehydrogenase [Methanococcoides methylutens]AKB84091.1 Dihydrolipoamide dehydrogenase [Methanococcoides methylutens MM1]